MLTIRVLTVINMVGRGDEISQRAVGGTVLCSYFSFLGVFLEGLLFFCVGICLVL